MANPELCPTCIKRGDGECAYEEAVKSLTLGEITKAKISKYKRFAEQRSCTKMAEVNAIIRRVKL